LLCDHQTESLWSQIKSEAVTGFWFAWYAFHPDTTVYTAPVPVPAE